MARNYGVGRLFLHVPVGLNGNDCFVVQSGQARAIRSRQATDLTFGNIRKTPEGPKVDEEREPITDIFDEENEIMVIAEMPGIDQADIKIELKEDILDISATGKNRTYHKELLLPVKVSAENLSHKFTNGILEIRIKK